MIHFYCRHVGILVAGCGDCGPEQVAYNRSRCMHGGDPGACEPCERAARRRAKAREQETKEATHG